MLHLSLCFSLMVSSLPTWAGNGPLRKVYVRPVDSKIFSLPNGSKIDLSSDLNSIFQNELSLRSILAPSNIDPNSSCHIEVQASVSTLELELSELGIRLGFSPAGPLSFASNLAASARVKGGTIAMDFSTWECEMGMCSMVASSSASHATASTSLDFGLDFGVIKIGPNFVHNTPVGKTLRKIMSKGIDLLMEHPGIPFLSWNANVVAVDDVTLLTIDAGVRDRLNVGQELVVYKSMVSPKSQCRHYQAVGYGAITQVDPESSVVQLQNLLGAKQVEAGDLVMVRSIMP